MPKVTLPTGETVDIDLTALLNDDGTPFAPPAPPTQTFTAEDMNRAREEERNKLYSRLENTTQELTSLREQVGSLTSAEQARQQELEAEQQRLQQEAEAQRLAALDPTDRVEQQLAQARSEWERAQEELRNELETERSLRAKEQEYNNLRGYIQQQVAAHTQGENADIAPELVGWIDGNSQAEVDAAIARAVETSAALAAQFNSLLNPEPVLDANGQVVQRAQRVRAPVAPPMVGVRATSGPSNYAPPGQQPQPLPPEQIRDMPMNEYAKNRQRLIGAASDRRNVGMF